jgi:hypothetical protein
MPARWALLNGTALNAAPGPPIRDLQLTSRVIRVIVGRDTQN